MPFVFRVFLVIITLVILVILSFITLHLIVRQRGVKRFDSYPFSDSEKLFVQADYIDAYSSLLVGTNLQTIDKVAEKAFQKGKEIFRSKSEVVYQDGAPGLDFLVSYRLDSESSPKTLTITTAVFYKEPKGRRYFRLISPIHRTLAPFMLSRMTN